METVLKKLKYSGNAIKPQKLCLIMGNYSVNQLLLAAITKCIFFAEKNHPESYSSGTCFLKIVLYMPNS